MHNNAPDFMNTTAVCTALLTTIVVSLAGQGPVGPWITAIGCVDRAAQTGSIGGTPGLPPAPPATAGVLANASDPTNVFLLNGATAPDASTATRAQAAAGHSSRGVPTAYVLDGKPQDFEGHLGQRVEVTGTLIVPNDGALKPPRATSNISVWHRFGMLAQTCSIASANPASK